MQPPPPLVVVVRWVTGGGGEGGDGGSVWCVVVGGGGGGAAWVVVGGGGGGAAACVVVGGGGALVVWVVITAGAGALCAAALCAAGLCRLCLGFGLAGAVVVVAAGADVVVGVVAAGVVAATLWLEVDEEEPHALRISVSTRAASAVRGCLMVVSVAPGRVWLVIKDAGRRGLLPGSEQPMNALRRPSKADRCAATIAAMVDHARGSVLVVDDEPTITEVVARYLNRAGYRTHVAATGREALDAAAAQHPDLVVLDLMLPGIDGLEVMRRLRDQDRDRVAVILLTAKSEESDRVIGLRLGADDYVVKPFSPAELVARVDAVLRRFDTTREQEAPIELSDMTIDPGARQVRVRGEEVQLTHREFDVLLFLARHPGQAFSRNQLMDAVWQYSFYSDTSTVTVHVRRLRSKIESDPARPRHIQTVWGVGYRFQP
jgi:DNA-binding response OmpR family regulator